MPGNIEDVSKEEKSDFKNKLAEMYDLIKASYKKHENDDIRFDFDYNREPEVHKLSEYVELKGRNDFHESYCMNKKSLTKNVIYQYEILLHVLTVHDSDLRYGGSASDKICDIFDGIAKELNAEMTKRSVEYCLDGDTDFIDFNICIKKTLHPKSKLRL